MYEGKEIIYSNNLSSDQPHTNELVVSVSLIFKKVK